MFMLPKLASALMVLAIKSKINTITTVSYFWNPIRETKIRISFVS